MTLHPMPMDLELRLSIMSAIHMPIDLNLEAIREILKTSGLEILNHLAKRYSNDLAVKLKLSS